MPVGYNVSSAVFIESFSMKEMMVAHADSSTNSIVLLRKAAERASQPGPNHVVIGGIYNPNSARPPTNMTYV